MLGKSVAPLVFLLVSYRGTPSLLLLVLHHLFIAIAILSLMNRGEDGNMIKMYSPDDPLFFLHHSQIDRIWAIWQDYWNQTEVDPYGQEFSSPEHYNSEPASSDQKVVDVNRSMSYVLTASDSENMPFFFTPNGETPTLQDMHKRYEVNFYQLYKYSALNRPLSSLSRLFLAAVEGLLMYNMSMTN